MRRIAALSAVAVSVLLLAACGQDAPGGAEAQPPADAPAAPAEPAAAPTEPTSEYSAEFGARGTEPFWRADVVGGSVKITQTDAPEIVATNAGLAVTGHKATWTAQAGAKPVVLTVIKTACSDGMSDLAYAYTAELKLGETTLKGCGFPLAAEPREGQ